MAERVPAGWCAVVLPKENEFQGYFIYNDEVAIKDAHILLGGIAELGLGGIAELGLGAGRAVTGTLEAVLVEGAVTKRPELIMAASTQLLRLTDERFFAVIGAPDPGGTTTERRPLAAQTVEEARALFNALPEVVAIKERIAAAAPRRKH